MPIWLDARLPDAPLLDSALPLLLVALVPLALMTLTSFAKTAVVFSALRNALGAPDVPSSAIITSVALALSVYVMAPVLGDVETRVRAVDRPTPTALLDAARPPFSAFLARNTGEAERALFSALARERQVTLAPDDLVLLWPSFVLSELKQAFTLGFLLALPFLVLDLLVAHVLLALGLSGLPAAAAAFPLKLLLFVSVDGFSLLSRALVLSYR